jgi:hypothetical protein
LFQKFKEAVNKLRKDHEDQAEKIKAKYNDKLVEKDIDIGNEKAEEIKLDRKTVDKSDTADKLKVDLAPAIANQAVKEIDAKDVVTTTSKLTDLKDRMEDKLNAAKDKLSDPKDRVADAKKLISKAKDAIKNEGKAIAIDVNEKVDAIKEQVAAKKDKAKENIWNAINKLSKTREKAKEKLKDFISPTGQNDKRDKVDAKKGNLANRVDQQANKSSDAENHANARINALDHMSNL